MTELQHRVLLASLRRAKAQGNMEQVKAILKEMVAEQPGTELTMKALFETEDPGRVLSTVRGEAVKRKSLAPTYFKRLKKPQQGERKLDEGQELMVGGDYLRAFSTYDAVANDENAPEHVRETAKRMATEATKHLNKEI